MGSFRYQAILALFLTSALLGSCSGGDKNANARSGAKAGNVPGETANSAKTNVEELSLLVNVPYETDDVVWKEDAAKKHVVAVLHFSKQDADKIVAAAAAKGAAEPAILPSESWFPAELVAQSEMSGEEGLRGSAYPADEFYLEPFTSGRIVRVNGTDYFVLQLSAK
jgi:hypothetical protein